MKDRIKDILQQISLSPTVDSNDISDITTGDEYIKLKSRMGPNDITLTINTDGVPIFKSSRYSVWPLFATINEITIGQRKGNTILHSLWFNKSKPAVDTFFEAFIAELRAINEAGIFWIREGTPVKTMVEVTTCICDAPARAMLQKFKQFNGHFGCGWCKHEGESINKGQGHVMIYVSKSKCKVSMPKSCTKYLEFS